MELIDTIRTLFSDLQRDSNDSYFTVSAATPKSSSGSKPTNASNTSKTSSDGTSKAEWRSVESPTDKTLIGVTTTTEGPFAVGTGGNVLTKRDGEWRFAIRDGPATRENTLTCVDVTDDGTRIWFAGSSGALGCYDATEGKKYDYSAPKEKTSTWEAIAVSGNAGSELIRVANGSGEVLPVTVGEHGCPSWGEVVKPGSGSTIPALDFGSEGAYAIDTSGNVFEEGGDRTESDGDGNNDADNGWTDIGVKNAQVNFFDVLAGDGKLLVTGSGGRVYRYDRPCENWTPVDAGKGALHGIAEDESTLVVVGASGRVYERLPGEGWTQSPRRSRTIYGT